MHVTEGNISCASTCCLRQLEERIMNHLFHEKRTHRIIPCTAPDNYTNMHKAAGSNNYWFYDYAINMDFPSYMSNAEKAWYLEKIPARKSGPTGIYAVGTDIILQYGIKFITASFTSPCFCINLYRNHVIHYKNRQPLLQYDLQQTPNDMISYYEQLWEYENSVRGRIKPQYKLSRYRVIAAQHDEDDVFEEDDGFD